MLAYDFTENSQFMAKMDRNSVFLGQLANNINYPEKMLENENSAKFT
jgi:hypothetical protein